jgi:hypothetical protein
MYWAATIRGTLKQKSDGNVLSIAEHNKASMDLTIEGKI